MLEQQGYSGGRSHSDMCTHEIRAHKNTGARTKTLVHPQVCPLDGSNATKISLTAYFQRNLTSNIGMQLVQYSLSAQCQNSMVLENGN